LLGQLFGELGDPIVAVDDAHVLQGQACGCLFHEGYTQHIDHHKEDLLRCMAHESGTRTCLPLPTDNNQTLFDYSYPTDVLYGLTWVLCELYNGSSQSTNWFLYSSSDPQIIRGSETEQKAYVVYSNLPWMSKSNFTTILPGFDSVTFYLGRVGLLMQYFPVNATPEEINKQKDQMCTDFFAQLCDAVQQLRGVYDSLQDVQKVELLLSIVCRSIWFCGGYLDQTMAEHDRVSAILLRSGIGVWESGRLNLQEPCMKEFVDYCIQQLHVTPSVLLDRWLVYSLGHAQTQDTIAKDANGALFQRCIVQSVLSQLKLQFQDQPLDGFMQAWGLDRSLLPAHVRTGCNFLLPVAGTMEDFNLLDRTEYFPSQGSLQEVAKSVVSYDIPSDFPSLRCVAPSIEGTQSLCFIWFFIKTSNKPLCSGEFLSALNSLSLNHFIPRKASDRYKLLQNYVRLTQPYQHVYHLRIFLCSSGSSTAQLRSVQKFNQLHPDQPIFLVQANHWDAETRALVYGEEMSKALQNEKEKMEYFATRNEKKTQTLIDLSAYVLPHRDELLPSLMKESGSLISDTKKAPSVPISSQPPPMQLPITKSLSNSHRSRNKRRRKPEKPFRIPPELVS